jgi:hypothetical protein
MMEAYTFVDIFETKGLEYLLLISFLILLVVLVRYLNPVQSKKDNGEDGASID